MQVKLVKATDQSRGKSSTCQTWYNERMQKTIDLSTLLKNYSTGWVAITSDYKKIVVSGKTLKEVTKKINEKKLSNVVLISASKNYRGYVTSV